MRKLFIAALALGAMVACNNGMDEVATTPAVGNQTAYLSVSLKAAGDITRATASTYEDGSEAENKIDNATFYFFDANGEPYSVAEGTNAVIVTTTDLEPDTDAENEEDGIEAYSDVILVLKSHKNNPPAKMVALINAPDYKNQTLAYIQSQSSALKSGDYFVMSNSVYKGTQGQGVVVATEILPENIFVTADETGTPGESYTAPTGAKINPVEIYVERVAAKVRVNVSASATGVTVPTGTYPIIKEKKDGVTTYHDNTFVKVLGWDVTNATTDSYLIKNWNQACEDYNNLAAFRSHWAVSKDTNPTHTFTFNYFVDGTQKNAVGSSEYYHENTNDPINTTGQWFNGMSAGTKAAQLVVATQFVDANGNPKQFGSWYGQIYDNIDDYTVTVGGETVTKPGLKSNMINNAAKKIFVKTLVPATNDEGEPKVDADGNQMYDIVLNGITVGDVDFYQTHDVNNESYDPNNYDGNRRYMVRVKAKSLGEGKTYADATGKVYTETEVNAILNTIEPAMIWTNGYAYYYTLINHLGGVQGIVRNHLYDVNIQSFTGFGTPVYDPTKNIIPEDPEGQDPYHLTAQINVLSWALVQQNVGLGK